MVEPQLTLTQGPRNHPEGETLSQGWDPEQSPAGRGYTWGAVATRGRQGSAGHHIHPELGVGWEEFQGCPFCGPLNCFYSEFWSWALCPPAQLQD